MRKVCPLPTHWARIHSALCAFAEANVCQPPEPPKPLILAGWNFTDDGDKSRRWEETIQWAKMNDCEKLATELAEEDWHSA